MNFNPNLISHKLEKYFEKKNIFLASPSKKFQLIRTSRLTGYMKHIYECLVLFHRFLRFLINFDLSVLQFLVSLRLILILIFFRFITKDEFIHGQAKEVFSVNFLTFSFIKKLSFFAISLYST